MMKKINIKREGEIADGFTIYNRVNEPFLRDGLHVQK